MVNYSHIIGEAMVLMQKPSVIESPSGRSLEKAPRWDLMGIEGCGGGKVVSWLPWMFLGYKSIYRRKKQVGGPTRGPRGRGARRPTSWLPRCVSDFIFMSSGFLSVQERSSQRFHSIWYSFSTKLLNKQKTKTGTGLQVNRLVPKITQNSILMHIKHPKQTI